MLAVRSFSSILTILLIALLPLFEGSETPNGLFIVHSIVLLSLGLAIWTHSRLWVPRFLLYFVPFAFALLTSTWVVASYKYAGVLQLWDYCMAGLFATMISTTIVSNQEDAPRLAFHSFLAASLTTIVPLWLTTVSWNMRWRATFVNPNDFAAFCLLLILFGLFQFDRTTDRAEKKLIVFLLFALSLCLAFSYSRGTLLAASIVMILYLWNRKPNRYVVMGILFLFVLSSLILIFRFSGPRDPFAYYRLRIWKHSLVGVLENPYLGIGTNMLQYQAPRFNFPADQELGRYGRIAKTADNQYIQILSETGFLGILTFLIGWIALYFTIRKLPKSYLILGYSFYAVSVIALFGLPFHNTAITFLFLFLVIFAMLFDPQSRIASLALSLPGKLAATILILLMFIFLVFLPYAAYRQMRAVSRSTDLKSAENHLSNAMRYNPYQPYYRFSFIRSIVAARPQLQPEQWLDLANALNESIRLNPMEPDFYANRGKIYVILLQLTHKASYYTQAISSYQAALDRAPYNVFLRSEYAYFLYQLRRWDLATAELQKVISFEPAYLNARLLLAELKLKENDVDAARKEFSEFEKFYQRYQYYKPAADQTYIQKLLQVNPDKKEELRALLNATNIQH